MKLMPILCLIALASKTLASDHNNFERGRPLLFDDAYSIAYGEREFQTGLSLAGNHLGFNTSLGYGFAKNQEISFGFDADRGSSTIGEVSFFQNLAREINDSPAFGLRLTSTAAAGQKPSGNLRLIATKALQQYDKIHLNLDFESRQVPGFLVGYSAPIGYPKRFDQTLMAEVGYKQKQAIVGVGMRRQIDPRSVLDFGIESGKTLRLTAGFSIAF